MGFSRQEYWSGLPFPSPGDLPYPGIEPRSPALQADALTSEPPGKSKWVKSNYTVHGIPQARILEWVAFPFSRRSSQPRDQTQVSHIAGRFFTSWATSLQTRSSLYYPLKINGTAKPGSPDHCWANFLYAPPAPHFLRMRWSFSKDSQRVGTEFLLHVGLSIPTSILC